MSNVLNDLGLTLRQDFQTWFTQLQLDDLVAEHPLSDQVDQVYQLVQDLMACEQINASWQYWEAWLTSGFWPSDAGEVDVPDPPAANFPHTQAQGPHLAIDEHRLGYPEPHWSKGFEVIEPMGSSAPPPDPPRITSDRPVSSSVTMGDRDPRLVAAEGAQVPAGLDRAAAELMRSDRLATLSVLPDRDVLPSPLSDAPAPLPASVGEEKALPLASLPTDAYVNWDAEFTPDPPAGTFSPVTPAVKGMKDLSAFLQQTRSDILTIAPPIDADVVPKFRDDQSPPQSPQHYRSLSWRDTAEDTLPGVANPDRRTEFGQSASQGLIPDATRLPLTVENATGLTWQQIKMNAITDKFDFPVEPITVEPVMFESISDPISDPISELIDPPIAQPSSAPRIGQPVMNLHELSNSVVVLQSNANLMPLPRQEDEWRWANGRTQDRPSSAVQGLEPASLSFSSEQPDPGLSILPLTQRSPKALPLSSIAAKAGPVILPERSELDLDLLLEVLQQEINQDYERFYGS